ncbi:hypothetical protein FSP39_020984 [Pinctada imbricata]|uniref:C2H2-type domain-containing protein n=1 Tax=Pinctada imbricata TaxID=66713 RepID=A0AA88Y1J8_PINIB|nr:hypothetical protein FSP39_020984 [Pinctada imbricata]
MDVTLLQVSYSNEEGRMTSLCEGHDINVDAVIQSIESLCLKLSVFGHEYILVTASHTNTENDRQMGSAFGLKFLNDHKDLVEKFRRNSKGLTIVKSDVPFENLSCQEQSYPSVNKRKRTAKDAEIGELSSTSYISSASSLNNFQRNDSINDSINVDKSSDGNFNVTLKDMIDKAVDSLEDDLRQTKQASSMDQSEEKICQETPKSKRFVSSNEDTLENKTREKMMCAKVCLSNLRLGKPEEKLKDASKVQDNVEVKSNLHNDNAEPLSIAEHSFNAEFLSNQNKLTDGEFSVLSNQHRLSDGEFSILSNQNVFSDGEFSILSDQNRLADAEFSRKLQDTDLSDGLSGLAVENDNDFDDEEDDIDDDDAEDDNYHPNNEDESTDIDSDYAENENESDSNIQSEGTDGTVSGLKERNTRSKTKRRSEFVDENKSDDIVVEDSRALDHSKIADSKEIEFLEVGNKYECLHCHKLYDTARSMRKHKRYVVQCRKKLKIPEKHKSSVLSKKHKSTVSSSGLEYELIHNQDGSYKYKCLHCQFLYSSKSTLNKHHRKLQRKVLAKESESSTDLEDTDCDDKFTSEHDAQKSRDKSNRNKKGGKVTSRSKLDAQKSRDKRKKKKEGGKDVSKDVSLKCSECDENFDNITAAKNHSKERDHLFSVQCPICRQIFPGKYNLKYHAIKLHYRGMDKEIEDKEVSGQCLLCDEMIESEERIVEHLKIHRNDFSIICDSCQMRFDNGEAKVRHDMNCHHAPLGEFSCTKCPQKFKFMFVLDAHDCSKSFEENMGIVNELINDQLVCYVCKKNYGTNRKGYMAHLYTHNTAYIYECHMCNKKFKQKSCLRKHLLCSHAAKKKYICDTCGKLFAHSSALAFHIKTDHLGIGKDVQCPECGKIIACVYSDLCDRCGAAFRQEDGWKSHMKSHLIKEGAGPGLTKYGRILKCSYCGKLFGAYSALKVHIRYVYE